MGQMTFFASIGKNCYRGTNTGVCDIGRGEKALCLYRKEELDMNRELFSSTGIQMLDLMLCKKLEECRRQYIEMDIFVYATINKRMRELGISTQELLRLFGDLIRNAMHAIVKAANTRRDILLVITCNGEGELEFQIYDNGVPFPRSVLSHLGERRNEEAGTGNGLADMMEILDRVQASLEITPLQNENDIFTKRLRICFDEKATRDIHLYP